MQRIAHSEIHLVDRIGWLRAAVLGANDGVISTASLLVGVAAAAATKDAMVIAGVAGLVAGAMSMAAGEYVSVSAQSDTEMAELAKERQELRDYPKAELAELREIYQARGLDHDLAMQVAEQLTAHDALGAHMRDELQITEGGLALAGRFTRSREFGHRLDCDRDNPIAGGIGRLGGQGRRRQCLSGHGTGGFLGRPGYGGNSGGRRGLRRRALMV
jgi:hypothetical protein